LPHLDLLSHRFEVALHLIDADEMQSINEKAFECLASTGVKGEHHDAPNANMTYGN
jgi:hypothetical protein